MYIKLKIMLKIYKKNELSEIQFPKILQYSYETNQICKYIFFLAVYNVKFGNVRYI